MTKIAKIGFLLLIFMYSCTFQGGETMTFKYRIARLDGPIPIDGDWNKSQWEKVPVMKLENHMGELPSFVPVTEAKAMYDAENIYVIFRVRDRYVRCITNQINGPVWEDSCVEFFFSPDEDEPLKYFNLEINCGGTALMHYNRVPRKESVDLDVEDIKKIEIAHSMPEIVDPEIRDSITWIIEYRVPIEILRKYSKVTLPAKGVVWKANFYKIADKTSNPHYLTWAKVENPKPDFHLPAFFGDIVFE